MSARFELPFQAPVVEWFESAFEAPTGVQVAGWRAAAAGRSALLLAPTGSGKTLAAFLAAINRIMFSPEPHHSGRLRVVYVSPLKALAVDVERNLRAPIAGISAVCERRGVAYRVPDIAVRSGDTPAQERNRFRRAPPDILVTTPESLYLLLTSNARVQFASVETVIVDEIHAMVPSKRGSHLAVSLERLERLRERQAPLQRLGLSATQRPLEEVARLLVGGMVNSDGAWLQRDVEIVDAGFRKQFDLSVEVPVEDMSRLGQEEIRSGPAAAGPARTSIWPSIHPRLVELVRAHRSTMIFANSRRLAERLSAAMNELAGEELALAHHGSVAAPRRAHIEDALKRGELRAIVATSSLELGIDMGAVDLVVQVESPPSIASGLQRIGRSSHAVGGRSKGVIFPKYRGDLLPTAAAARAMAEGQVEHMYYPRNPLDVLAQQIVAMAALDVWSVDDLFATLRSAAPFAELPRSAFEGVLDMLSGRYPSDEFAELRPRIIWDRALGTVRGREGARRMAVLNGGTIPDRGLYGVFLADGGAKPVRVGELDEEMVFESRQGDVFLLGASSWRIEEITHDRVLVSPAHGQPGKMPFWHGDRPGRPLDFGRAIGALGRELSRMPPDKAETALRERHGFDERAAKNLVAYLQEQLAATGELPSDEVVLIERFRDELGDYRVCILSPFGIRVHAPWAMTITASARERLRVEVEAVWSDDGIVLRFPESDEPPALDLLIPSAEELEYPVSGSLGQSSLFAARFRENAARALLLPRRMPGKRTALWAQRKRAADLLAVAARYPSFPIVLETFRECLRDQFDLPGLARLLRQIEQRQLRVVTVDTQRPSPFASALLFSYVANFIYEGDAPLAERRAQALSIDQAQLRELLGEAELRELLDPDEIERTEAVLQRKTTPLKHPDAVHDLLLAIGDLSLPALESRTEQPEHMATWVADLVRERRIFRCTIGGELRYVAAEEAARWRDSLGIVAPAGLPKAFLAPAQDPLADIVSRFARTHGPFTARAVAERFGLGIHTVELVLRQLAVRGKVVQGEFLPGGRGAEWCDVAVLQTLKRKSLAKLRKQVEPVDPEVLVRFALDWHGLTRPRRGIDGVLAAVEQLQGAPIPASALETEVLSMRIQRYTSADLDSLCASGEVLWRGVEPLGSDDGRIALYTSDSYARLAPPVTPASGELAGKVRAVLEHRGASFFSDILAEVGGFNADVLTALWDLVWAGEVSNDTLAPLRSLLKKPSKREDPRRLRGRRQGPPGSEGRWSLLPRLRVDASTETERRAALANMLLERHGILTREALQAETIEGGFSAVYEVLKRMEEAGRVRRGYFVAGLGATQFALPGADERLRALREPPEIPKAVILAATDPAQPYGTTLSWPAVEPRLQRSAGAFVVLFDGRLLAYLSRSGTQLRTLLPENEPERGTTIKALASALAEWVDAGKRRALLLSTVDGEEPARSAVTPALIQAGFAPSSRGLLKRMSASPRDSGVQRRTNA